jgi:hypothetical protein
MAPKTRPPIERFIAHTRALDNGCIEWTAYRAENGSHESYELNREKVIRRSADWRRNHLDRARELTREGQRRYRERRAV